jgi:hypothetical protein
MTPEEEDLICRRVERLEVDHWWEVDSNWGGNADAFYENGGIFDMGLGSKPHVGRGAIRQFYAWRKSRGTRTARHVITNVQVAVTGPRQAMLRCVMSLYAADGEPILPSQPPIMIADIISDYVQSDDGVWRVRSRTLRPVFMGGVAPTIMPDNK